MARRGDSPVRTYDRVYAIKRLSDGKIKIGCTAHMDERFTSLQKEHGEIILLGTLHGYRQLEAALHKRFAEHRIFSYNPNCDVDNLTVPTDWFHPHSDVLDFVQNEMQPESTQTVTALSLPTEIYVRIRNTAEANGSTFDEAVVAILTIYSEVMTTPSALPASEAA